MIIRRAEPGDAEIVAGMIHSLARDLGATRLPRVTGDQIREHVFSSNPLIWCWVAELDGASAGTILLEPIFSTWRGQKGFYIVDLYVSAEARGRGVGERLIRQAALEAHQAGYEFLRLDVEHDNSGAMKLYDRLGFRTGTERIMFLNKPGMEELLARNSRT